MPHRTAWMLAAVMLLPLAARADVKLGYVDLQRALLEVDEGREAKKRLQKTLDEKQKELDREQEALRKEKEVLDKQASMMSEETRIQRQTDLQKKLFELAQKWEKGKAEMATKERTELQGIFQKMDPIIASIAQREGLTMVFEKTDSGLVYAPAHLDLTNELVRLYNDQNKVKKAAAAPKKDAPKK
ncbi:MAG: OmpH family outer membrane protein [Myxococcota bacterium]